MSIGTGDRPSSLRIVAFHVRAVAYAMTREWAARHGHQIVLLVTTPGPSARRSDMYRETIAAAPPEQEIHITTHPKRLVPIVAAARPDLIICGSFPYRIPAEVVAIPRLGAVNLHPAPLPRYRGPNPLRQVYAGEPLLGGALHRIAPEFDAGPILSLVQRPLPADATPEAVLPILDEVLGAVFEEGLARAIAGEAGTPQDEAEATYAGAYSEEERRLDWCEPRAMLQRRATGLFFEGLSPQATIAGREYAIDRLTPLPDSGTHVAPGTVVARDGRAFTVAVGDGAVLVTVADAGTPLGTA